MMIKSRMGVSADGFVSTPGGVPALPVAAGFEPGISHGYPEFTEGRDAAVMGPATFLPGLGAPLSPQRASPVPLTLLRADRTFPDGSAERACPPA
jgi:hypothetical protein